MLPTISTTDRRRTTSTQAGRARVGRPARHRRHTPRCLLLPRTTDRSGPLNPTAAWRTSPRHNQRERRNNSAFPNSIALGPTKRYTRRRGRRRRARHRMICRRRNPRSRSTPRRNTPRSSTRRTRHTRRRGRRLNRHRRSLLTALRVS